MEKWNFIKGIETPSIKALGTDSNDKVVMEVSVPEKGDVYVDILNRHGETCMAYAC